MKLILRWITILLWITLGYQLSKWRPPDTFVEVMGEIKTVDSVNHSYQVQVDDRLLIVETDLPLPQTNKKIIILQPK